MRVPFLPAVIALLISLIVDWLIYKRCPSKKMRMAYGSVAMLVNLFWLALMFLPKKSGGDDGLTFMMWGLFIYLSIFLSKTLFMLFVYLRKWLSKKFRKPLMGITYAGGSIALTLFIAMWWGALFNRYNIDVEQIEIKVENLPQSFDGYKIVQISDLHVGTFGTDTTFLNDVVKEINSLNANLILFSGDIVNRHSSELEPFMSTLSRLKAADGVWSVMGNHDYGDYYRWERPEDKQADIDNLKRLQGEMGWNMLNDSHTWLCRGNDSIALVGVENIGDPPFHVYGSLKKAYPEISDKNTKILLSHNPVHWTDSIADKPDMNVALTLSGHTHAMQFKIFGLSPAAMRYSTWGGQYTDSLGRDLYVNIGLGTVGFPSRVGATPEITLITLKPE